MALGSLIGDFVSTGYGRGRVVGVEMARGTGFRLTLLRILAVAGFLALGAALVSAQLWQGRYYRALAEGNRVRQVWIHAPRGTIYDRHGVPLTVNLPAYRLQRCSAGKCSVTRISKDQAILIAAKGTASGENLEVDTTRSYPYKEAAASLLGYVSEVSPEELKSNPGYSLGDMVGRGGAEQEYQEKLAGKEGKELVEVDALGKKLRSLATVPPVPGKDIKLAVDIGLQRVALEAMGGQKGAVVATNPATGEILALVSSPGFDPNIFTDFALPSESRTKMVGDVLSDPGQPLFNRAISGTYPSGSTFKIVTAVSGLETGKINEDTFIDDPGILVVGPYKFPNWKWLANGGTQGRLNVVSALRVSNDIFFYRVGEWVGVDGLSLWAKKFGLGKTLGVDLPGEAAGLVPDTAYREQFARSWYLGDTYHLAIGQGDLLVTPLQLNGWTAVIANGGILCKPQVLLGENNCRELGISRKTIELVREGLRQACAPGGTGWPLFNFAVGGKQIATGCKTGTAEFGDPRGRTHAWFTVFAPADDPSIVLTVLVEGGGEGSDVAAPIAKKILEKYFEK